MNNISAKDILYDNLEKYIFRNNVNPDEFGIWEENQFGDHYKIATYYRDKDLIVFSPMEFSWEEVQTIMFATKMLRRNIHI